jgi:hypothetical protein
MKRYLILTSAIFFMLISPLAINPAAMALTIGPIPIPGNLIPIPNPSIPSPIVPSIPNLGTVSTAPPAISLYSITQTKSGLVASDPLNNAIETQQQLQANPGSWTFDGDAPAENATYDFFKDTQGLHIGVQAPYPGTWAGYFAETPNTSAMLFHAVVATPVSILPQTTPAYWYENGLYVQTSQPFINYVTCFLTTSQWGTVWSIASVTGNAIQGTSETILWTDQSANQPLTRDCTIITNGNNYLKVYLDGTMVYQSNSLNLQMPGPFNAYLEPQSSYAGQLLNGTYKDYYATSNENVQVTNNPILAATVKLVSPTGTVLASSPVGGSGTAAFTIGQYHMPLAAYIKVYDSNGIQLASTSNPVNIFGGDVYSISSLPLGL